MWLTHIWEDEIDLLVFYIFCGVAAIIVLIGFISIFLPCCLPNIKGISPGGTIDFYVIIGGRLITATVLIKGLKATWATSSILTAICQLYPAVLLMGLTMFFGGLFIKAASIYGYRWYRKPSTISDEWKPNLAMWALLIVMGIASIIWCVLFTPSLTEVTSQNYRCFSEAEFEWKVATSAWHGLLLFLALVLMPLQCKAARKTPCKSESDALGVAILNSLLSVVAGVCFDQLYQSTTNIEYAVLGGLTLWMVLICDIAMLAGKASMAKKHSKNAAAFEEDERYDVIKEDAVSGYSGEAMEMNNAPTQFVNESYNNENSTQPFDY